jgi:hypothetical protein
MQRGPPRWTRQSRLPSRRVGHGQRQTRLQRREMTRADAIEKRIRVVVAAEEDVLSVVDALAGFAIEKRRRTSAKARTSLDDDHALAGVSESHSRAETREARADDDDVGGEGGH